MTKREQNKVERAKLKAQKGTLPSKPTPEKKKAICQFNVSIVRESGPPQKAESPESIYEFWKTQVATSPWFDSEKEHLVAITVNTRHQITGWNLVSVGTLNEALAHPREILCPVIVNRAHSWFLVHNHPSGDPSPSKADRELTRRIAEAANLLQIPLLDHVIAGDKEGTESEPYFSFREMGLL